MNFLDVVLAIPLVYGIVQGWRRGIVKEAVMLVAIIFAIYVSRYFSPTMSLFLQSHLGASEGVAAPLSYILVLVIFGGGMYVLAFMLTRILKAIKLGTVNRIFGSLFGLFKWMLIVSAVLCFFAIVDRFVPIRQKPAVQNSVLYHPIEQFMGHVIPFLDTDKLTGGD